MAVHQEVQCRVHGIPTMRENYDQVIDDDHMNPEVFFDFHIKEENRWLSNLDDDYSGIIRHGTIKQLFEIKFTDMMLLDDMRNCVTNMLHSANFLHVDNFEGILKKIAEYAHEFALNVIITKSKATTKTLYIKVVIQVKNVGSFENLVASNNNSKTTKNNHQEVGLKRKRFEEGELTETCIICLDDFLTKNEFEEGELTETCIICLDDFLTKNEIKLP
ncbi:hypothetical protein FRX31_006386 [Thalictrum thalictroides]|uniref:Uncharacterized protein n=1 Tax=Thalictrum thalictroides TaxID=46969 RepID=A0A7J6X6N6_THATH|nr:hypothetical protein FRX31_006386 [Thalictrum thalictroides]